MAENELLPLQELVVAALEGQEIFSETSFALYVETQGNET